MAQSGWGARIVGLPLVAVVVARVARGGERTNWWFLTMTNQWWAKLWAPHNDSISALFEEKGPALFLKRRSTSPFKNRQLNAAISPPFFSQYLSVLHLGKAGRLFREKAVRGKGGERAVKGR